MELECYPVTERPPELVPGRPQRDWMDHFTARHPYRCLPLSMANSSGWELLCPTAFTAEWNGGPMQGDITLRPDSPNPDFHKLATSHFSHGVLTFHAGYLFRTPPGWSMMVMGAPNHIKDGIQPLSGVVETDWLPFPFTMNWMFTRPGKVRFEKGEPFCFITLLQDKTLHEIPAGDPAHGFAIPSCATSTTPGRSTAQSSTPRSSAATRRPPRRPGSATTSRASSRKRSRRPRKATSTSAG
jgi:hypothetical protein